MLTDAERYVRQYGSDCVVMIALRGEPINSETDLATGEVLYKFPKGMRINQEDRHFRCDASKILRCGELMKMGYPEKESITMSMLTTCDESTNRLVYIGRGE